MENASKALIMAAEVLVGVMIISLGVYLFNTMGTYSRETSKKITDAQIAQFNSQFQKFYGDRTNDEGEIEPIKCTIHDIASIVNLAKKNNEEYELTEESNSSPRTFYIQIDLVSDGKTITNLEKYTNVKLVELIKKNDIITTKDETGNTIATSKYYRCISCKVSEMTKRVNYMKFVEITK